MNKHSTGNFLAVSEKFRQNLRIDTELIKNIGKAVVQTAFPTSVSVFDVVLSFIFVMVVQPQSTKDYNHYYTKNQEGLHNSRVSSNVYSLFIFYGSNLIVDTTCMGT